MAFGAQNRISENASPWPSSVLVFGKIFERTAVFLVEDSEGSDLLRTKMRASGAVRHSVPLATPLLTRQTAKNWLYSPLRRFHERYTAEQTKRVLESSVISGYGTRVEKSGHPKTCG